VITTTGCHPCPDLLQSPVRAALDRAGNACELGLVLGLVLGLALYLVLHLPPLVAHQPRDIERPWRISGFRAVAAHHFGTGLPAVRWTDR